MKLKISNYLIKQLKLMAESCLPAVKDTDQLPKIE